MRIWNTQPIATFVGGNAFAKIEQAIRSVLFRVNFSSGYGYMAGSGSSSRKKTLSELFPTTVVTAYVILRDGGQREICTRLPLAALFEYAQADEGVVLLKPLSDDLDVDFIEGSILISPGGALEMKDDEVLHIQFDGLDTEVVESITAYGIEMPQRDFSVYHYSNLSVGQDQIERAFDCTELTDLIIPDSSVLFELLLSYSNGVTCRYTLDELRHISNQNNDISVAGANTAPSFNYGAVYGYSSYHILNVQNAKECKLVTNGNGFTMHGVKVVAAVAPSKVQHANESLVDTSGSKLLKDANQLEISAR